MKCLIDERGYWLSTYLLMYQMSLTRQADLCGIAVIKCKLKRWWRIFPEVKKTINVTSWESGRSRSPPPPRCTMTLHHQYGRHSSFVNSSDQFSLNKTHRVRKYFFPSSMVWSSGEPWRCSGLLFFSCWGKTLCTRSKSSKLQEAELINQPSFCVFKGWLLYFNYNHRVESVLLRSQRAAYSCRNDTEFLHCLLALRHFVWITCRAVIPSPRS